MLGFIRLLPVVVLLVAMPATANGDPAKGKLLVATDLVGGPVFAESVVLILRYDAEGALGLIINRPTDVPPEEALRDGGLSPEYAGSLYLGGPVAIYTLRALIKSESPPERNVNIFGNVYLAPIDEEVLSLEADASVLRFYLGYAGWGPGQLDREMAEGSWHVIDATEERVFSDDPAGLWRRLTPPESYRVSL